MHPSNFRCRFCLEEKPLTGSRMEGDNRYCARCYRFFQVSKNENARPPVAVYKAEPIARKPRGTVKWWDEKAREWRWVSKRSKPRLDEFRY